MRTQSGHFDPPSWKITFGIINEGSRLRKVVRINSKFTPSMKPEPHNTARYFDEHTGEYLPTPSHCDCPDGPFLCSHQTGELLLIRAAQVRPEWGIRDFTMLAEPIKSIQSLPLPVKLVYGEISKEEKKLAKSLRNVARDIARDHPGYTNEDNDGEMPDEEVEAAAKKEVDTSQTSLDVCAALDKLLAQAEARQAETDDEDKDAPAVKPQFSSDRIKEHSDERRTKKEKMELNHRKYVLQKYVRRKKNLLWTYTSNKTNYDARVMFLADVGSEWLDEAAVLAAAPTAPRPAAERRELLFFV